MALNSDQQKALDFIQKWWKSNQTYMVLDGAGGTGKSFLVNEVLKTLQNCSPILLAPTHEALKQLKDKVDKSYDFKTIHAALGISPVITEKELKFEHVKIPSIWENINLAIIDEVSMLDEWLLEILIRTKVKIIFIGHKSQLPPVKRNRKVFDPCISPIFEKGYPTITLKQPMRNTGELWDFNNLLEASIYDRTIKLPASFDKKKQEIFNYLHAEQGKKELLTGETKIVLWTNDGVDRYNKEVRTILFGEDAKTKKYLPGDKLILTAPLTLIDNFEFCSANTLKLLANKKENLQSLYSNTKVEVLECSQTSILLNAGLRISLNKILSLCEGKTIIIYEPIYIEDYEKISTYYEHIAWGKKSLAQKNKAYKERHFIMSCFAKVKHFYAATSHRLQGSSIEKVIVIDNDICKNPNKTEQAKCRYVACSRAINELMIYRGF